MSRVQDLLSHLLPKCRKIQGVSFIEQTDAPQSQLKTLHLFGSVVICVSWRTHPFPADLLDVDEAINRFAEMSKVNNKRTLFKRQNTMSKVPTVQSTLELVEAAKSREQAEADKAKADPTDGKAKLEELIKKGKADETTK